MILAIHPQLVLLTLNSWKLTTTEIILESRIIIFSSILLKRKSVSLKYQILYELLLLFIHEWI
jgi:hypothetical protein